MAHAGGVLRKTDEGAAWFRRDGILNGASLTTLRRSSLRLSINTKVPIQVLLSLALLCGPRLSVRPR